MVVLHSIHFFIGPFGIQHLAAGPAWVAVQVSSKDLFLYLVPVENVVDADVQSDLTSQYLRNRHYFFAIWYISP